MGRAGPRCTQHPGQGQLPGCLGQPEGLRPGGVGPSRASKRTNRQGPSAPHSGGLQAEARMGH
eukprot:656000-Alexandrium_andersonii.AAC.1